MHRSLMAAGALAAVLVLLAAGARFGAAAEAGTSQFPPATTGPPTTVASGLPPATTVPGVLVPDPNATVTSTPPTTTAATEPAVTQQDQTPAADQSSDPTAERTVWVTIAGLGIVAFLIMVLTIIYARHTRPDRWHGGQDAWDLPDSPEDVFAPTAARSVFEHHDDEQGFWWAED